MIIRIKKDGKLIKRFTLEATPVVLGRSASVDIQLYDSKISRQHIKIINKTSQVHFEDLNSKFGMFFKGEKVSMKTLKPGQSLRVANYILTVEAVDQLDQKTMPHMVAQNTEIAIQDGQGLKTEVAIQDPTHLKTEIALDTSDFITDIETSNNDVDDHTVFRSPQEPSSPDKTLPMLQSQELSLNDLLDNSKEAHHMVGSETEKSLADIQTPEPAEPKPTHPKSLLGDSFMKAIAVSDTKEDDMQLTSSHQATLAKLTDSQAKGDQANPSAPYKATIKIDTSKINSQDLANDTIGVEVGPLTNPLLSKKPDAPANADDIQFSSFSSKPKNKSGLSKDFLNKAKSPDRADLLETKEIDLRQAGLSLSSKTEVRNFQAPSQRKIKKPKSGYKIYMYGIVALLIASLLLLADKEVRQQIFASKSTSKPKQNQSSGAPSEDDRITRFKIDKIKELLKEKNLDSARAEMNVLLTEYPNNTHLKNFVPLYKNQKTAIETELEAIEQEKQKKQDQIKLFSKQAQKLVDSKAFDAAIETYQKVLALDPDNTVAQSAIADIESVKIQNERKDFAKKRKYQTLDRIFKEGIEKFEAGEFGKARSLFKQVTQERGHRKYKQAKSFLSQIATQTDGALKTKIENAKSKMNNTLTLPESYTILKDLTRQFPQHKDAKSYFAQSKDKMNTKAKQLYAEAIAQEELAGDFGAALDLYHQVLVYAPDDSSNYHQKAKAKIAKLESS